MGLYSRIKKDFKKTVLEPATSSRRTMRLNHFLSTKYVLGVILTILDIALFLGGNYLINVLQNIPKWFFDKENVNAYFGVRNLVPHYPPIFFLLLIVVIIVIDVMVVYRIKVSWSDDYLNVGQKGVARWTTLEEIQEQYKEIDEKEKPFEGIGGTIVARYGDKIYIDTSPSNTLITGITRSGKDEMYVVPTIDVLSRAEIQSSMVTIDPKFDGYKTSKKTLEKRGYDVYLMNLVNPERSMGYNPLTVIVDAYKRGDYAGSELLAQTFAYSIFNPDDAQGDMKYFARAASGLCCAMIIAAVTDALEEDRILNEQRLKVFDRKRTAFQELSSDMQEAMTEYYFKKEKEIEIETEDSFWMEDVIDYIPEGIAYEKISKYERCINLYSIINTFTELARQKIPHTENLSALDLYFSNRPMLDRAKLKYASVEVTPDRTKGGVFSEMLGLLSIFTFENVAKMTAENSINLEDIGFGKKPVAIFIGIPDYDKSIHFMTSIFMRQVYFVLAKRCGDRGHCVRPVKFICNEFGNTPSLEAMDSIITVCLSRWISFDLYVQSWSQLPARYDENVAKTIKENCANKVYIMTDDNTTAKEVSEDIGSESVIDVQRTGKKLDTDKQFMETVQERPLLSPYELRNLYEGECVVTRTIKRRDLKGRPIKPHPIFNSRENGQVFKYRYQYLTDTFPNPDEISLDEINTESRSHINHRQRIWDYETTFRHFEEAQNQREQEMLIEMEQSVEDGQISMPVKKEKLLCELNEKKYSAFINSLIKILGYGFQEHYGITDSMKIVSLKAFIRQSYMTDQEKESLLTVLEGEEYV